jgi:hypothetical protein
MCFFFRNFWPFWVWRTGLTEKQLRNVRHFTSWEPAGELDVVKMAGFPDKVDWEAGASSMLEEDNAVSLMGYCLRQFTCAFCGEEMDDLKTHVEFVHRDDLFKFLCGECGFNAQGPRHLREHIKAVHVGNVATVTLAIIDLEGHRRAVEDGNGVADVVQLGAMPRDLEVVNLEVESMLDSSENRAVDADQSCAMPGPRDLEVESMTDLSGSDESFQCPKCWISFPTKEGLEGHADRSFACDVLWRAQTESARVPPLDKFLCGHCGKHCEATVETLEGAETGVRSECQRRFKAVGAYGPPEVTG